VPWRYSNRVGGTIVKQRRMKDGRMVVFNYCFCCWLYNWMDSIQSFYVSSILSGSTRFLTSQSASGGSMNKKYQYIGDKYTRLSEECAEIIQMCCKIKRFGELNYHPKDRKKIPNVDVLQQEIKDMLRIIEEEF
jgi:hypothetical protein